MKPENIYFSVTPRVVPADKKSEIVITPLFDHCAFGEDIEYRLSYYPTEEFAQRSAWPENAEFAIKPLDGAIRFTQYFEAEQEHVLYLECLKGDEWKVLGDFRVYSVEADLYTRRAYKGDLHIHSSRSDGRESPGYVAGACRRIGLDFMAITDHKRYAPSIEAQEAFAGVEHDLRIFRGEEVHPPQKNPVHMINFGGSFSVNKLFESDEFWSNVERLKEELAPLPPGVDPYQYASCVWCFNKIREGGGLAIFCHPYWFTSHRYAPSGAITTHMFETQPFDAYEIIGGFHRWEAESNTLQVARYNEERAKGKNLAIVGVSDAHGCERDTLFGWYYTIVFSRTSEQQDLIDNIKGLYSVAVEAMAGEMPRAYGPFRLVKYALFLMREVFPQHDVLCEQEGQLMIQHVAGDPNAKDLLRKLRGRTAGYLDGCWKSTVKD